MEDGNWSAAASAPWLTLRGQDRRLSALLAGSQVRGERENVCGASEGETVWRVPENRTGSASPTEQGQDACPHNYA